MNKRLAAGEGALDRQPHHNFGNLLTPKSTCQSLIHPLHDDKEENQSFLLAVANFLGNFSEISRILTISNFYELLRKKSQLREFTWLVATESTQKRF